MNVSQVLRSIAADIEEYGHARGGDDVFYTLSEGKGGCCLLVNPTLLRSRLYALADARLVYEALLAIAESRLGRRGIVVLSDTTPTDELLALLRSEADRLEQTLKGE